MHACRGLKIKCNQLANAWKCSDPSMVHVMKKSSQLNFRTTQQRSENPCTFPLKGSVITQSFNADREQETSYQNMAASLHAIKSWNSHSSVESSMQHQEFELLPLLGSKGVIQVWWVWKKLTAYVEIYTSRIGTFDTLFSLFMKLHVWTSTCSVMLTMCIDIIY